ncbi:tRNA (adenosine(37)-N6)-dimethylallyltransferase MiaA [Prosthecobacter sp.]|uniref:tRNA (adenosine(37)-N6)-dimethylallyltransferase MiaA n=1 Tax=Prosthecobacter sp. TaxID=1965333 RepID=UPI002AB9A6C8|nr:tRNA (adenosine(37)-N6)-dimethylallyltransferase MiaA [Prosthecobacter sp.]MDZ4405621.1 tRNA (adenosine(37)-N6)-dimethylallyltransferase MiaA [Prosthecobacter sp.]
MLPPSTFLIAGPTASGKSALALALAERVGGEIVNADAFQLYAGIVILSAKPSAAEMARVPHHLYSVVPLTESCDAQRYHSLALPVIADIAARGRVPIVVGGSGLYLKALTHGLSPLPPASARLREQFRHLSPGEKVVWLLQRDPEAATTVNLRNPRYVERALEICLLTGRPQSGLRRSFVEKEPQVNGVILDTDRETLYARINQRTLAMFEAGLIAEVAALGKLSPTAEKAIGIREVREHLAGHLTLDQAIDAIQQATRRYAKRQATWFRRERCFQTICLDSLPTTEYALTRILELFPCLRPSSQSVPSLST